MRSAILLGEPDAWEVELGGSQAFVSELARELGLYSHGQPRITSEAAPTPAEEGSPSRPEAVTAEPPDRPLAEDAEESQEATLDSFYARFMHGRQDATLSEEELVLLFGYYFEHVMEKVTWAAWDIMQCFGLLDLPKPANMIGLLSTMARQRGSITPEGAGSFKLSDRSTFMVETALRAT